MPQSAAPKSVHGSGSGFILEPFDLARCLTAMSDEERATLRTAGAEVLNCQRILKKTSSNVVSEILRHQGSYYEWSHYPKGDAVDWETHSLYYYHSHPKEERPDEHGHFHTFLCYDGMPDDVSPLPLTVPQAESDSRIGAHIVAISMDKRGRASKLFTVNRWVTDETWYPADAMKRMIDRFDMDHAFPSWATNRWLSAMMILFKPQIAYLLEARDAVVTDWAARHPDTDAFEDRGLEVAAELDIDVEEQVAALG